MATAEDVEAQSAYQEAPDEPEPKSPDDSAELDDADDPADEEGADSPKPEAKVDTTNPFHRHPQSYTIYSTITENRYKERIHALTKELHDYAENHQTLLRQRLTYEELLQGMLYPGEDLIPVKPMLIRDFIRTDVNEENPSERYGVRMFLTNKRLFFLDADLERIPILEEAAPEDMGRLTLSKLKITYQVTDDIWYYPVPLTNLKGMSLDIHFATTAHGWITQKRPWWSIVLFSIGLGALAVIIVQVVQEKDVMKEKALLASTSLCILAPMIFFFFKVYGRSEFKPSMFQQRCVTLGCKDPITQKHSIFKLFLEDKYSMVDAKNYLSLMQEYAPHLSGFVLAD
eukprot:SAG22_NODE_2652_length_2335_cov_1.429785_2_plen_343_part_00